MESWNLSELPLNVIRNNRSKKQIQNQIVILEKWSNDKK